MTTDKSIRITEFISRTIAERAPYIDYTPRDVRDALDSYSDKQLETFIKDGLFTDDFECLYVMNRFIDALGLRVSADRTYLHDLFAKARKFLPEELENDPYMRLITVPDAKIGKFLLTSVPYERGEFFHYAMPSVTEPLVTPSLGFFTSRVLFPSVYEGDMPWVSVCPSEIYSMTPSVSPAVGRVLVLGLGLGYYPLCISEKEDVSEIVIVERQKEIIELFETHLLPQFPHRDKIKVVRADAFDYLEKTPVGRYDFCFADIWENDIDGAECYKRIKPHDERLVGTRFEYWIEKEILWRLSRS